ncbi:MAG: DUF1553 domain-containing protein, partial [Planctomycetia bacterium]
TEQLAGDEIAPNDADALTATGFLRHTIYEYNNRDVRRQWREILNELTDATSDVFLGLGMGCARCHDHKFDPILQKDYYRLQAFLGTIRWIDDRTTATPAEQTAHATAMAAWLSKGTEIRAKIAAMEEPVRKSGGAKALAKFSDDLQLLLETPLEKLEPLDRQLKLLAARQITYEYDQTPQKFTGDKKKEYTALKAELEKVAGPEPTPLPTPPTVRDISTTPPVVLFPGGRAPTPVDPGFLTVLEPKPTDGTPEPSVPPITPTNDSTGRRSALAEWLARPDHPLVSRVLVNRLWQYHFGKGLAANASDFGKLGEKPSHPELLDWLAGRFVADGRSWKAMHRLMVLSATYRQTALRPADAVARRVDPDNRFLWRGTVRRLDAEEVRDAMLAVAGEMNGAIGGPSQEWSAPRRSIYLKLLRNKKDDLLDVFDAPDGFASCALRNRTVTSTQALLLINGEWPLGRAERFAKLLERTAPKHVDAQIATAYSAALGRAPDASEQDDARRFLAAGAPLVDFCHALLNSNEFLYVD